MVVWAYDNGARDAVVDPLAYIAGARVQVQEVFAYSGGTRTAVWSRAPITLTATPTLWDQIALVWTAPGAGASSYKLYRGDTLIYSGGALAWMDSGRWPATQYGYRVEAVRSGAVVSTATATATTPARADLGLVASATAWNTVGLSWSDPSGNVDEYRLKRNDTVIYTGTAKAYSDGGRSASTTYNYKLDAMRGGLVIPPSDTASATTGARPVGTYSTGALGAVTSGSYSGSGGLKAANSYMWTGYYDSTWGRQKSAVVFPVPGAVRASGGCLEITKVEMSFWVQHHYYYTGGKMRVAVHHGNYPDYASVPTWPGSTAAFGEYSANRGSWLGGTEWVDITTKVCPGRYTVRDEFRLHGAWGLALVQPNDDHLYYGYTRGAQQASEPRLRITYKAYSA